MMIDETQFNDNGIFICNYKNENNYHNNNNNNNNNKYEKTITIIIN